MFLPGTVLDSRNERSRLRDCKPCQVDFWRA
jgi:hypothetical protein